MTGEASTIEDPLARKRELARLRSQRYRDKHAAEREATKEDRYCAKIHRLLDDPDFLETDLPRFPEKVIETVTDHPLLEAHRASLERHRSGFVLRYPVALSARNKASVSATASVLEVTFSLDAEDQEAALFLARVILADHVPPDLPPPLPPEEPAPVAVHSRKWDATRRRGRVSTYAPAI